MMNSKLVSALTKMTEVEFRTLYHCVHIADIFRDTMKKYNKDRKFMCEKLEISSRHYNAVRNGAFNYDMRFIASLQALRVELETDAAAEAASAKQIIEFPQYEFSRPIKAGPEQQTAKS